MIVRLLQRLIQIYVYILCAYALLTWFPGAMQTKFGQFIARLARPYLSFFDRWIPPIGGISFSVVFGIIVLELASKGLEVFL